ncbi:MFS transporter [Geodermatophilus maliterrae]|uniref:MFS transporter n=1 Tax=Geodermatophilus maliterrae TaxID=3162531 RepID=A0ABV3XNN5_9ACTN
MLAMLDLSVVILALPQLGASLGANGVEELWITDVYGFLIAGFLVTMGRLGDRIGRRRLLLVGVAAFGLLSVLAVFSTGPEMMIVIRALLGVAGATIMPSTLALLRTMFPDPKQMGAAMGIWSTAMIAGISLGPVVGGLLLNSFWWGSVFLIAVPVTVLLLVAGPFLLPESRHEGSEPLDLLSVVLSLAAILPLVYGLKELARSGWTLGAVAAIVVGAAVGIAFARRQRELRDPLLDLRLFALPAVGGSLGLYLLVGVVQGGNALLMTQHLQLVEALSPLATALWLLLPSVIVVLGIQITMKLVTTVRPAAVLIGGVLVAALGMLVLTRVGPVDGFGTVMLGICLVFLGVSPVGVLSNQLVMMSAPPERAGSAGSLSTTAGELGTALGIASLGSVAAAVYHSTITVPGETPADAAGAAEDSIVGAATAAPRLSPETRDALVTAAREAFTQGYNVVAVLCAVLFVLLAGLVWATLRRIPPVGAPPQQADPDAAEGAAPPEAGVQGVAALEADAAPGIDVVPAAQDGAGTR